MTKRKKSPTLPPVGVKPDIKPNSWDARLYQTSELAMSAIEREQAEMRAKTVRLREVRLRVERTKLENQATAPQPDEIAGVVPRIKAQHDVEKKQQSYRRQLGIQGNSRHGTNAMRVRARLQMACCRPASSYPLCKQVWKINWSNDEFTQLER